MVLLACCGILMHWLFHAENLRQQHDPTLLQMAGAAIGFFCFSTGATLAAIGNHIFDRVEISQRWARQSTLDTANADHRIISRRAR